MDEFDDRAPNPWNEAGFMECECPHHTTERQSGGRCRRFKEDPRTHDLCTACLFMCAP